ncbi:MAG: division/cell wall cluster transcriptional repressor MraZ [Actinomycetes bacterium]
MEFYDQFEHNIDDKGRLVLPSAYRSAFTTGGFVTYMGDYAALFTPGEWDRYRRKLQESGEFTRRQLQTMFSFVTPFTPDAQHRISIGAKLRTEVGIDREVTIVGSGSHAAVYARSKWDAFEAGAMAPDESGRSLADKIADLGFL